MGLKVAIVISQSVLECVDHNLYVPVEVCVCGGVCVCVGMHQIPCEVDSRQSSVTGPVDWNGIKNTLIVQFYTRFVVLFVEN